jgi:hypothetical protein
MSKSATPADLAWGGVRGDCAGEEGVAVSASSQHSVLGLSMRVLQHLAHALFEEGLQYLVLVPLGEISSGYFGRDHRGLEVVSRAPTGGLSQLLPSQPLRLVGHHLPRYAAAWDFADCRQHQRAMKQVGRDSAHQAALDADQCEITQYTMEHLTSMFLRRGTLWCDLSRSRC